METSDIWEKIIIPLVIGPLCVLIKVLYDRWDTKKTQTKMLVNKIKLKKIENKLEKFYWPLYILLINDYELWSKIKFDDLSIEITESASESEIDVEDGEYIYCSYVRKEGSKIEKCNNPVAHNCVTKYGAYCIKHQEYRSKKAVENWTFLFDKVKNVRKKSIDIVDYDEVKNENGFKTEEECKNSLSEFIIDIDNIQKYKNIKRNNSYKKSIEKKNEKIILDIEPNSDKSSSEISMNIDGIMDKVSDNISISKEMLENILKQIEKNQNKITKIIRKYIYIAEPKSLMGKQLVKFIKFSNIFISELHTDNKLINPCNYGAGYPKKLLPMVERKVFNLQKQYNDLINNYY